MDLSDQAVSKEPDLLVWPEASLPPFWVLNPTNVINAWGSWSKRLPKQGVWQVWGADTATNNVPYNSAVVGAAGRFFSRRIEGDEMAELRQAPSGDVWRVCAVSGAIAVS